MTTNYPITASGSTDMLGDEFPSLIMSPVRERRSPLAADIPGADTSNWSSAPRPSVTAWEGADMDAYWFDGLYWHHCQTGAEWVNASLDEAIGRLNEAQGHVCRPINETVLVDAVADALGVPAREVA